ncbi:tetraacyldisaccharide 4'-kinase [Allopusillimonas soli]|uniref:Tetraacyldisaccharide 4'-kinase n=1 Tax=Allopusillimonas soli TaxID=659016 RepID=A0A853FBQ6_9BURK|nr:tetraacyldisaccharide 4'-kinase [Allopusillimonas soli]NYT37072.1 tetraacyldisaccharide 4'-kinase [Allopusillimonas soli]TEA75509.1 tetraacyldisaccharide 4'-kinase [Allopusillimonas soli]
MNGVIERLHTSLQSAWQHKGMLSNLLYPLSLISRAVAEYRRVRISRDPGRVCIGPVPVIVVGNIYVGGTGKTPVVIALAQSLRRQGWRPGIISRGYGVRVGTHPRCGQGSLDAARFGDEPALIAAATGAPVSVHPRRCLALGAMIAHYPAVNVVIADDGLQHHALGRHVEILVQDARGTGNGRMLPAGPLREPPDRIASVDLVVTNLGPADTPPTMPVEPAQMVVMRLTPASAEHLVSGTTMPWDAWLAKHGCAPAAAVAAIGNPARYFSMLRESGVTLSECIALPDHDDYAQPPFSQIDAECILITAKDAVKCRKVRDDRLWVVHAAPRFSDPAWTRRIDERLRALPRSGAAMAASPPRD